VTRSVSWPRAGADGGQDYDRMIVGEAGRCEGHPVDGRREHPLDCEYNGCAYRPGFGGGAT
jgi:hypothetical protein